MNLWESQLGINFVYTVMQELKELNSNLQKINGNLERIADGQESGQAISTDKET
jgi:hypothetical protein